MPDPAIPRPLDDFTAPLNDAEVGNVADLREGNALFKVLTDAMPQMVWSTLPDGFHDYYNARWYEFTGVPDGSTDGEGWSGMFHVDDRDRARARWGHSLSSGEPYEIEYRLRHRSGQYRWTLGRALPVRDPSGAIIRWIGTCTDIDAARRNVEAMEILSRELSHRIKNIFAVIGGLIGLSARSFPAARDYARVLQQRVGALARAHEFVRPHSDQSAPLVGPSTLHTMLRDLLSPYPAIESGHLAIQGADMAIDDRGATPIALVFHELATNAVKYGALSAADGRVAITTTVKDAALAVHWEERGGPVIHAAPEHVGFGTRLAELSIVQQLGGQLEREWHRDGLSVMMRVPANRLHRP